MINFKSLSGKVKNNNNYVEIFRNSLVVTENSEYKECSVSYSSSCKCFSFIFAFKGVGLYYRLEIDSIKKSCAVYLVRNGIDVFLKKYKSSLDVYTNNINKFRLFFYRGFIQFFINDREVLNLFDHEIVFGALGFKSIDADCTIKDIVVNDVMEFCPEYLCLGDGFTGGRWPDSDFDNWPDMIFRDKYSYVNCGINAANSNFIMNLIDGLELNAEKTILMVGADDVIEKNDVECFLKNLKNIVGKFGSTRMLVCNIAPRLDNKNADVIVFNRGIEQLCIDYSIGYIDVYGALVSLALKDIYRGVDHPEEGGQLVISNVIYKYIKNMLL